MTMKKMFSAVSAAALLTTAIAATAVSANADTTPAVIANATICGQMGTYGQWDDADAAKNGSTIAKIDGNAQYEATFNITGDGTGSIEFLILQIIGIDNEFNSDKFPDLSVTVDNIYVDGTNYNFTNNAAAYKLAWYENDIGCVRVFLQDTWGINGTNNLGLSTAVTSEIKVVFTVGGLYNDGTSNVTETTKPTTDPTDPTDPTGPDEPEYELGDINEDDVIDARDASLALNDYALTATGAASLLTAEQFLAADVNGDEVVDARDASVILSYYAYTATSGTKSLAEFIAE